MKKPSFIICWVSTDTSGNGTDHYEAFDPDSEEFADRLYGDLLRRDDTYSVSKCVVTKSTDYEEAIPEKEFPNGFHSWMETHHEIVAKVTDEVISSPLVEEAGEAGGTGFIYLLAEAMTDEFEAENKGVAWGEVGSPDYWPTIEAFCDKVLNESFEGHRYHNYFYGNN